MARNKHVFRKTLGCWWPCEERVLITMLEDQLPFHFIAVVLGRDRTAVYAKINNMKKNGDSRLEQAA